MAPSSLNPLLNKSILLCSPSSLNPLLASKFPTTKLTILDHSAANKLVFRPSLVMGLVRNPIYDPPEIPAISPEKETDVPTEMPVRPIVPDFDPVPPENPADPPPLSPGPNPGPEFPGPPDLIPPKPEAPRPPVPPRPEEPEILPPPHGPEVTPHMPLEAGSQSPVPPGVPPPIMGSDGLVFY